MAPKMVDNCKGHSVQDLNYNKVNSFWSKRVIKSFKRIKINQNTITLLLDIGRKKDGIQYGRQNSENYYLCHFYCYFGNIIALK